VNVGGEVPLAFVVLSEAAKVKGTSDQEIKDAIKKVNLLPE
jgi:hypothetical protein